MIKLIENKTGYKFYGIKLDKLNGWTVYRKNREGELQQQLFLTEELFSARFTPLDIE